MTASATKVGPPDRVREQLRDRLRSRDLFIFDLDGTIADTTDMHARAFTEVFAAQARPFHYPDYSGMSTRDVVRSFLTKAGVSADESTVARLVEEKQALARSLIAKELVAFPGVDAFISWSVGSGRRLAMVTSGSAGTVAVTLRRLGYEDLFNPVITADDVDRGKPDPAGYRLALSLSGFGQADAIVFEDAEAGIAAATASGLDSIDVRVHPWTELLDAVL